MLEIEKFQRRPFEVEVVLVTDENMAEVAEWCGGELSETRKDNTPFIKLNTLKPLHTRQTRAFAGDRILKSSRGWKIYTERAFFRSFNKSPSAPVVSKDQAELVFPAENSVAPTPITPLAV